MREHKLGRAVIGRQWRAVVGLVTTYDVGGVWYHRLTAPRWACMIAQATREFPSFAERRGLVEWARGHSEGRQTLLYTLTRTRLTLRALRGDDVCNEDEWIAS